MCPDSASIFLEAFGYGAGSGFVLALVMIYVIFRTPGPPKGPLGGGHGAA